MYRVDGFTFALIADDAGRGRRRSVREFRSRAHTGLAGSDGSVMLVRTT
jgi:hypothetical protein